jgi:hypothetical protein
MVHTKSILILMTLSFYASAGDCDVTLAQGHEELSEQTSLLQDQEPSGTPFSSPYLSARLSEVEMRSGEEEMGFALYGKIEGGEVVFLGRINSHYTDDPNAVAIDEVVTAEAAYGNGVATALYDFLLKQHEKFQNKPAERLQGTRG